jgi:hypothetical protein
LDGSVDKEIDVEAVREAGDRRTLSPEEWERLASPLSNDVTSEQSFEGSTSNSAENQNGDAQADGEEIELEFHL